MNKRLLFLGSDKISEICLRSLMKSFPSFHFELITTSNTSLPALYAESQSMAYYFEHKGSMEHWKILSSESPIWSFRYDFIVSASFGYLIPAKLIAHCNNSLNMHPSLLPLYRGSSPIQHAIYNQDPSTGVSIITIDPNNFDKGLILKQEKAAEPIGNETYLTLSEKLAHVGGRLLSEVIENYGELLEKAVVQDEGRKTSALKFPSDFAKLKIEKTDELYARFRCLYGTSLSPHLHFEGKRVNIFAMRKVTITESQILQEKYSKALPGSLWLIYPGLGRKQQSTKFLKNIDPVLYMKTGDGWIGILDFLVAGRPHSKNSLNEFVKTYFDVEAYTHMEDLSQDLGEYLKFE